MNVKTFAEIIGAHPETVRRWVRIGKLKADHYESRKRGTNIPDDSALAFLETYKRGVFKQKYLEYQEDHNFTKPNDENIHEVINNLRDKIEILEKRNQLLTTMIQILWEDHLV